LTYCYAADFKNVPFSAFRWIEDCFNLVMGNKPLTKLRPDELNEFRQLRTFTDAEIRMSKKKINKKMFFFSL